MNETFAQISPVSTQLIHIYHVANILTNPTIPSGAEATAGTATSVTTDTAWTPTNDTLYLAWVALSYAAGETGEVVTVSGNGLTWVLVDRVNVTGGDRQLYCFRAMVSAGATNGSTTATSLWLDDS